jgi:hypothetical protein
MKQQLAPRALAAGMSALVTLLMLGGIDTLAHEQHAAVQLAKAANAQATTVTAKQLQRERI